MSDERHRGRRRGSDRPPGSKSTAAGLRGDGSIETGRSVVIVGSPAWIKERLADIGSAYARSAPVELDEDAKLMLLRLIDVAAQRLKEEGKSEKEAAKVAEARVVVLLERAMAIRRDKPTEGQRYIAEQDLYEAFGSLCPGFWPFC